MNLNDVQYKEEIVAQIEHILDVSGAYDSLHRLLVSREEILLYSEMPNLSVDIAEFIWNYTKPNR